MSGKRLKSESQANDARRVKPKANISANGVLYFGDTKELIRSEIFQSYVDKLSKVKLAG